MSDRPEGIDVYNGDGIIDWKAVAASGRTFAFAKSSEGMTIVDARFADNWKAMRAAGIYRGAYHFGRPNFGDDGTIERSAVAQAELFFALVGPLSCGDLPPVLDLEAKPDRISVAQAIDWTRIFLIRAAELFGRTLVMYVGSFWRDVLGDPLLAEAGKCPLWTPRYSATEPNLPKQWTRWTIWQYTDGKAGPRAGTVPGVSSDCDQNVFNGTLVELAALAAIPPFPGRSLRYPHTPTYTGDDVKQWQARMAELGYSITVDGIYGSASSDVCRRFQTARSLSVDGVVGPKTWAATFKPV